MRPYSDGLPIGFCSDACFGSFMGVGGETISNPVDVILRFHMAAYPDRNLDFEAYAKLMEHFDEEVTQSPEEKDPH